MNIRLKIFSVLFTLIFPSISAQNFGDYASGVNINNTWYNVTHPSGNTSEAFNQDGAYYFDTNFLGCYTENSGDLLVKQAAIKTWRNLNVGNVCGGNFYYRIYPANSTPGSFASWTLNYSCPCSSTTLSDITCVSSDCSGNNQIWASSITSLDLTTNSPGDYIFEVYFDYSGSDSSPSSCSDTKYISNTGSSNYKAQFTINSAISLQTTDVAICEGDPLSLAVQATGGDGNFNYAWTYPNSNTSTDQNPLVTSTAQLSDTGNYTINVTDGCGNTASGTVQVTIKPKPLTNNINSL